MRVFSALTAREREVLELLVVGATIREVSRKLHISDSTARSFNSRLHKKLGVGNRGELCRVYFEETTRELRAQNAKYREALREIGANQTMAGFRAREALK